MLRFIARPMLPVLWISFVSSFAACGGGEFASGSGGASDASVEGGKGGSAGQAGAGQGGGAGTAGNAGTSGAAGSTGAINGTACQTDDACASKHCVDKVCCDAECAGKCLACSATKKGGGADGKCAAIGQGLDPDEECQAPVGDSCSGTDACQCHDGIKNGGETGVDCGGTVCAACLACDGACQPPQICFEGQCCSPDSKWCEGKCGKTLNNCGQEVQCGVCLGVATCGGGGIPNVCGCSDTAACALKECGTVTNLCGEQISCGTCSGDSPHCCADQRCHGCCGSGVQKSCEGANNPAECQVGVCNYQMECSTRGCSDLANSCPCSVFPNCAGCF